MNNHFVKYKDLLTIKEFDIEADKEGFVLLPLEDDLVFGKYQEIINMLEYGERIAVRESIYNKLINVAKKIKQINPEYKILVAFGFRDMKVQKKFFDEILEQVKNDFSDEMEMYEYIHEKIAVPEVSGHPTGGAVDVAIYNSNTNSILDYGCEILDYSTHDCYYVAEGLTEEQKENRKMLRTFMTEEEFAPYDGEWWHFSYGDKEWAFYYNKKKALYNQVDADKVFCKELEN